MYLESSETKVKNNKQHLDVKTNKELRFKNVAFTSDAASVSAGRACQLSQLHSLHWEDLVCSQIQVIQHLSAHPDARGMNPTCQNNHFMSSKFNA